jgi:hypothetical protein
LDAGTKEILEEHLLLRPIVLACNAKAHLKVAGLGVSLLQRIIGMRVVPEVSNELSPAWRLLLCGQLLIVKAPLIFLLACHCANC